MEKVERKEGEIEKGDKNSVGGDGNVDYLDCGEGFEGENICQNSSSCII